MKKVIRPPWPFKHLTAQLPLDGKPVGDFSNMLLLPTRQTGKTATTTALLNYQFTRDKLKRQWIRYALRSKTKKGPRRKVYPL